MNYPDEMTEEEAAEYERISRIPDFLDWHAENSAFWTEFYYRRNHVPGLCE